MGTWGEQRERRASGSRWVAAFCVVAVSALIGAIPTQALPSRGHVFGSTFEGLGEHALKEADGIAVDEATGDVYVADRSAPHEQVERFKRNGAGGYEFVSAFAVKSPAGIAVDNSTSEADPSRGDVYVVGDEEEKGDSEEHNVLYKYNPVLRNSSTKRRSSNIRVKNSNSKRSMASPWTRAARCGCTGGKKASSVGSLTKNETAGSRR